VLHELYRDIEIFLNNTPGIEFDYASETLYQKFIRFVYKVYAKQIKDIFMPYDQEMYDYFSMKYSSDIVDMFMKWKDVTASYNIPLFHGRGDTSIDIEYFLFDHILIEDPYNDEREENNIEDSIDETYV
jgi:hypothetical protein